MRWIRLDSSDTTGFEIVIEFRLFAYHRLRLDNKINAFALAQLTFPGALKYFPLKIIG